MKRTNLLIIPLLAALIVALIVVDCKRNTPREAAPHITLRGEALGTIYQVTAVGSLPENFRAELDSLFAVSNSSMSIFSPTSLLSCINRGETDLADGHIAHCVELAQRVSILSDGAYDITIAPLVKAFGFVGKRPDYRPNIDSLLEFVGYRKVELQGNRIVKHDPRVTIDLNSIAKAVLLASDSKEIGIRFGNGRRCRLVGGCVRSVHHLRNLLHHCHAHAELHHFVKHT